MKQPKTPNIPPKPVNVRCAWCLNTEASMCLALGSGGIHCPQDWLFAAYIPEGTEVARCMIARPMRRLGLRGAVRDRCVRTTIQEPHPRDLVNRHSAKSPWLPEKLA